MERTPMTSSTSTDNRLHARFGRVTLSSMKICESVLPSISIVDVLLVVRYALNSMKKSKTMEIIPTRLKSPPSVVPSVNSLRKVLSRNFRACQKSVPERNFILCGNTSSCERVNVGEILWQTRGSLDSSFLVWW